MKEPIFYNGNLIFPSEDWDFDSYEAPCSEEDLNSKEFWQSNADLAMRMAKYFLEIAMYCNRQMEEI